MTTPCGTSSRRGPPPGEMTEMPPVESPNTIWDAGPHTAYLGGGAAAAAAARTRARPASRTAQRAISAHRLGVEDALHALVERVRLVGRVADRSQADAPGDRDGADHVE